MIGRPHQIGDVRGEVGVGEIALAGSEAGEVEPQHRDTLGGERSGDPPRAMRVLAASEAMGEQRSGDGRLGRQIEACREQMAAFAFKLESLCRHDQSP
jgi:hypothetical protein